MLCPTFQPNPNLNEDAPWGRPELDGLTGGICLTLLKTEHYNTQDQETNDFRKLDIIELTPK